MPNASEQRFSSRWTLLLSVLGIAVLNGCENGGVFGQCKIFVSGAAHKVGMEFGQP